MLLLEKIRLQKREDIVDKADKENDDKLKQIITDKLNDENGKDSL